MSNFTTVDIPLSTVVLNSESLPLSLSKIVNNQGIIETYLETLYNTFEINPTNKAIGEYTPINSANSKKFIIYGTDGNSNPDTNNGMYIMQNLENITNQGYFRPFNNGGSFGTEIKTDKLTVTSNITFGTSASITFPDDITFTDIAINGNVSFGGSMVHSTEYVTLNVEATTPANNVFTINGSTSRVVVIDLVLDIDIYDPTDTSPWQTASNIPIKVINGGMIEGQIVEFVIRTVLDWDMDAITETYSTNLYFYFTPDSSFTNGIEPNNLPENDYIMDGDIATTPYNICRKYILLNNTLVRL